MPKKSSSLLLLVDDKPDNLDILIKHLEDAGHDLAVALSGEQALALANDQVPNLILLDVMMPRMDGYETCERLKKNPLTKDVPVIFMSALSDTDNKVKGFAVGGIDFVTKPFQREEVLARINSHLTIGRQRQLLQEQNISLEKLNHVLKDQINRRKQVEQELHVVDQKLSSLTQKEAKHWGIDAFIGNSPLITAILEEIRSLQQVDKTNVLVLGESGTGKELVSRAIHFGSSRKNGPFIAVNCSAIPLDLADAEFFGHTKGAFTGATSDRAGHFVDANGGTLFLDEIGDMPLQLQAKLLRVLEDGKVTAVGGSKVTEVDVRVVAATNVELNTRVQNKEFRQDLFYRLSSYVINLPALKKRPEDIPLLVNHFLTQLAEQMGREKSTILEAAVTTLQRYSFPGNVRELKNLIEHALISSRDQPIGPQHFHFIDDIQMDPTEVKNEKVLTVSVRPQSTDEEKILAYLQEHDRVDNAIAQEILGVEHSRASYLLKKLHTDGKLNREGQRRWSYYTLA